MDQIVTEQLTFPGPSGDVTAYLARPVTGAPWPALIVIHEVFGLVEHIHDLARRFAREGYLALAPDLYTHDAMRQTLTLQDIETSLRMVREADPDAVIAALPADQQQGVQRAMEWRKTRDTSAQVPNLLAALEFLKGRPDVQPDSVGAIGYCMGGGLVGRLATAGADIAAGVINYGQVPPLEEVPKVRCPLMGHYGGEDHTINAKVPDFEAAMNAHGKDFAVHVYEGAPHAFFNDTRPSYTPDAAALAWKRTLDFFERHLKRAPVPT